jgi:hypothetical protein
MHSFPSYRILAVEIRADRLGYAVFETPKQLRDFGACWFESTATAKLRLARLLRLSRPNLLVLRGPSVRYRKRNRGRRRILRIVRREARKLSISIASIPEARLNSFFALFGCRDKYSVAGLMAEWFPEISWRLPSKPKFYEPEPRALLYFDSIALGAVYLDVLAHERKLPKEDDGILSSASKWRS